MHRPSSLSPSSAYLAVPPAVATVSALTDPSGGVLRGPILVASDRSPLAGNAARVAVAVARSTGAALELVHALDPRGAPIPPSVDLAVGLADGETGEQVRAVLSTELRESLRDALEPALTPVDPLPDDWPVRIGVGTPADTLVREARASDAGLLVLGLRRRGPVGRAFQDETALEVLRHAPCPVLAVAPGLTTVPRCAVVGIDFGRASTRAAHLAARLLAPGGWLVLAYAPVALQGPTDEGEGLVHALGVSAAFDALVAALPRPGELAVERTMLAECQQRPPAESLLSLADDVQADLIAAGSRRYGRVARWILGSVSTDLVRDGRVSLLVVPPSETRDEAAHEM